MAYLYYLVLGLHHLTNRRDKMTKSLFYYDSPRVLSLELFADITPSPDNLFTNIPNDEDQPKCQSCNDPLHTRPIVCQSRGYLSAWADKICYDCISLNSEDIHCCELCYDFTAYPHGVKDIKMKSDRYYQSWSEDVDDVSKEKYATIVWSFTEQATKEQLLYQTWTKYYQLTPNK